MSGTIVEVNKTKVHRFEKNHCVRNHKFPFQLEISMVRNADLPLW